ncbi:PhzF family phenazine biosynthesis protein [Peptoniphilus catoniae]|uniref:PhzF family phenazine biosynthesis protein n=1 Tax=Peptoniphilus catoniae TaxID=1660341 RepID=UPI0010FF0CEB|nr:PhzF family phenazine biosynthesis protein [Peptoniphilus catoniae]
MRYYSVYFLKVFSKREGENNSLAVVIANDPLSESDMREISKNINQPLTVFVKREDRDIFDGKIFSRGSKVDLSPEAAIGVFYTLAEEKFIEGLDLGNKEVILITDKGKAKVELEYKNGDIQCVYTKVSETFSLKIDSEGDFIRLGGRAHIYLNGILKI